MIQPVAGRRAASMWRITGAWFTAPKSVFASSTAKWAKITSLFDYVKTQGNRERGNKRTFNAEQSLLWFMRFPMSKPTVTHYVCVNAGDGELQDVSPLATRQHWNCQCWRCGRLWIILWLFHKAHRSLCLDMHTFVAVVKHLWEKTSG